MTTPNWEKDIRESLTWLADPQGNGGIGIHEAIDARMDKIKSIIDSSIASHNAQLIQNLEREKRNTDTSEMSPDEENTVNAVEGFFNEGLEKAIQILKSHE